MLLLAFKAFTLVVVHIIYHKYKNEKNIGHKVSAAADTPPPKKKLF